MNSRERLLAVLSGKDPDRLPWAPLVDKYFLSSLTNEFKDMGYVELFRNIGADLMLRHVPVVRYEYEGGIERIVSMGSPGEVRTVFKTPVGTISQTVEHHSGTTRWKEYFIKDIEDIKVLRYVENHKRISADYESFISKDKEIGDNGLATASAPPTPLASMHEFYIGLENCIYFLYDYPELMEDVMNVIHENNIKENEIIAKSPSAAVFIYEDTSTTTISRDFYERYCLGQINDYAAVVKKCEKPYIVHMCGKLYGFRDLINRTKTDGIDSLCPPSTGDVWLHEGRKYWPDKIIIGGIEPAALAMYDKSKFKRYAKEILDKIDGLKGIILSTGDAVPHGTPVENLRIVTELINEKYGF